MRTWTEWKGRERANLLSLLELINPSSPALGHWRSWFVGCQTQNKIYTIGPWVSGFQTRTELHHQLSWLSSLQTADGGTSKPPQPREPIPIINTNHLLYIPIYILLVLFFWITLTNTVACHPTKLLVLESMSQSVLLGKQNSDSRVLFVCDSKISRMTVYC